jgi:hypothetical protein
VGGKNRNGACGPRTEKVVQPMETSLRCGIDALRQEKERYDALLAVIEAEEQRFTQEWYDRRANAHNLFAAATAVLIGVLVDDLARQDEAEALRAEEQCPGVALVGPPCLLWKDHAGPHVPAWDNSVVIP